MSGTEFESNWTPRTEADVRSAAVHHVLDESTVRLELKRELAAGARANKNLAKELASLALEGGSLLIGVADPKEGIGEEQLKPVDLDGLVDRVEQIAGTIPDPAIQIRCRPIPVASDPCKGYVLIEVPASGTAPHMVDGTYYGRTDSSKKPLTDAEVGRYHRARLVGMEAVGVELDKFAARWPLTESREGLHLVLVPTSARSDQVLHRYEGDSAVRWFDGVTGSAAHGTFQGWRGSVWHDGLVLSGQVGRFDVQSDDASIVELSEGCVLRMYMQIVGRAEGDEWIDLVQLVCSIKDVFELAAAIATDVGYQGMWNVSIRASGLDRGKLQGPRPGSAPREFSQSVYEASAQVSTLAMSNSPGKLNEQLLGTLLRGAGIGQWKLVVDSFSDD